MERFATEILRTGATFSILCDPERSERHDVYANLDPYVLQPSGTLLERARAGSEPALAELLPMVRSGVVRLTAGGTSSKAIWEVLEQLAPGLPRPSSGARGPSTREVERATDLLMARIPAASLQQIEELGAWLDRRWGATVTFR